MKTLVPYQGSPHLTDLPMLQAALCRRSLSRFVKEFWPTVPGVDTLVWNWHMDVLCDELQQLADDVMARRPRMHDLVVNVPFGTSKSTIISILFPAWVWTRMPEARFICATHTDSLVLDLATKSRDVLESEKYRAMFPNIEIRSDRSSKEDFHNTLGGERKSCTVGGKTPTGRHAHFIIVDDPLDPQGARSEAELETAKRFMTEVVPSRVVDKETAPTILVMQRLHPRDPTHVMLEVGKKQGSVPCRRVCLPGELTDGAAEVSPPELRDKYQDSLLDPKRLSRRALQSFLARLGSYAYSSQVLQNPRPPGGGRFKPQWFTLRARAAPHDADRVWYWDRAATADGGCYTAGVLMARGKEGQLYVEHVVHGQWEPNERNDIIVAWAQRTQTRYGPSHAPTVVIEAERGSTGLESFQGLARRLMGYRVVEDQPTGSKDVRAEPWADQLAAMNVWLVEDGTWDVDGYIEEHLLFQPDVTVKRLGSFKDRVDASSGAMKMLSDKKRPSLPRFLRFSDQSKRKVGLRFVVCSMKELEVLQVDHRCLLITFGKTYNDGNCPLPSSIGTKTAEVGHANGGVKTASGDVAGGLTMGAPGHSLDRLVDTLSLDFEDVDPAEVQDRWNEPLEPHGKLPADLIMRPEHGKRFWSFLLRKREPAAEVVVLADDGRRAGSLALAAVDCMGIARTFVFDAAGEAYNKGEKGTGPNRHVYSVAKSTRYTVAV